MGSGWNNGFCLSNRETGGSESKGAHSRSDSPTPCWVAGLGQHTHLPHNGQLHGAPSVSSPVHQARQEVSNESACNCGQKEGEVGVGDPKRGSPTHPPPHSRESLVHSLACLLTHSLVMGGGVPSLLLCEWSLRYNTPVTLLALPRRYVGTHLLGGSGGNKPGMHRSTQLFPSRS